MMKNLLLFSVVGLIAYSSFSQTISHKLSVDVDIPSSTIDIIDTIRLEVKKNNSNDLVFYLNSQLELKSLDEKIEIFEFENSGINITGALNLNKYSIKYTETNDEIFNIPVHYSGKIKQDIIEGAADFARGFSETNGIIFDKGVHLTGSSYWVPFFESSKIKSFELTVRLDKDWSVVSQGERLLNEIDGEKREVKYVSHNPVDQIYLIAAEWTEYEQKSGDVLIQAFLRTPDKKLADRYLNATADYIRLFEELIGDYPYSKFALVENFWETGFGMPSFTLLGEKIIRFPWIISTSYPHELLHNYWGNGVFVDYSSGNWCEGITAYMADHLIQEQQGLAVDYRRNSLQKYRDYVNEENDFPLVDFRSRNNPAQEAVGYGKCMMFNDMLRLRFGDQKFKEAYALFYQDNLFKHASFNDIRKSFEEVSGEDLSGFFKQWIDRKGAPNLEISDVSVSKKRNEFRLKFLLSQSQNEDVFDLLVPVAIYLEDDPEVRMENIVSNKRERYFTLSFEKRPLKIEIDPQFNIFRLLDRNEVPTSISQVVGSKNGIIVLPKKSKSLTEYQSLAFMWIRSQKAQGKSLEIVYDSNIESLPVDKTAWILGFENKFADNFNIAEEYGEHISSEEMSIISAAKESASLVYTYSNPANGDQTFGFIGARNPLAIKNLARKITHYGSYGFLVFEGEEANNILKGSFPIINSPLSHHIDNEGGVPGVEAKLKARRALAY